MKKMIFILIAVILLLFILCSCQDVKAGFLEPEGYTIAYFHNDFWTGDSYGYIKNDVVEQIQNGNIPEVIMILNPFDKDKYVVINTKTKSTDGIEFGVYRQDLRNK
jgi:hypothetical protein